MKLQQRDVIGRTYAERGEVGSTISGLAAVYYRDDVHGTQFDLGGGIVERIMPGAFTTAIQRDDVVGLFNHDGNEVLGRTSAGTLSLEERDEGLFYEIHDSDAPVNSKVARMINDGNLQGSSFAFYITDQELRDDGDLRIREIREVELVDVGPVTFPAYSATTTNVRGFDYTLVSRSSDAQTLSERFDTIEQDKAAEIARQSESRERELLLRRLSLTV